MKETIRRLVMRILSSVLWSTVLRRSYIIRRGIYILTSSPVQHFLLSQLKTPTVVRVNPAGVPMKLQTSSSDDHFVEAFLNGLRGWEKNSLYDFKAQIRGGLDVIDVGAYSGIYGIMAAKLGASSVICVEPMHLCYPP